MTPDEVLRIGGDAEKHDEYFDYYETHGRVHPTLNRRFSFAIKSCVRRRIALMNRNGDYWKDAVTTDGDKANSTTSLWGDEAHSTDARIALEKQWDQEFQQWMSSSERWGDLYAETYNRAVRGTVPPPPTSADLQLCRVGPIMMKPDGTSTLYGYQTESVRKASRVGNGLIAFDVGLGKTFTAIALLAYWRQLGQARRPIISVPKQVLVNWTREIHTLLPDYDVLMIGSHRGRDGKMTPDSKELKTEKWLAWQRGSHDVCVCTRDNLEMAQLTPPETLEIYNQSEWLRHIETQAEQDYERLVLNIEAQREIAPGKPRTSKTPDRKLLILGYRTSSRLTIR